MDSALSGTEAPSDEAARKQATDIASSCVVKAPAGSGKTSLLVDRALNALSQVDEPEEVVAVTFTNKAANEMRERILDALEAAQAPAGPSAPDFAVCTDRLARAVLARDMALGWGLASNPSRLRIMTIDSLASYITGAAPVVSGLGQGTSIDDQPELLYRRAASALIDELDAMGDDDPDRAALTRVLGYSSNRYEAFADMLSSMLARREQWLPIVTRIVSGVSFTTDELVRVVSEIVGRAIDGALTQQWIGALERFAQAAEQAGAIEDCTLPAGGEPRALAQWKAVAEKVLTKEGSVRGRITIREGFDKSDPATAMAKAALAELGEEGDSVAATLSDLMSLPEPLELFEAGALIEDYARVLLRAAGHLTLVFHAEASVDFQEIGIRAVEALTGEDGTGAGVLQRMDCAMRHIMVDEAQDTSVSQFELIRALTSDWSEGDGRSLFIVGDPQQSIYRFRQADVRLFQGLWETGALGSVPLKRLTLTRNFRSGARIVEWCNALFSRAFPATDEPIVGRVAHTPSLAARDFEGEVEALCFDAKAEIDEAEAVVERVRAAVADGGSVGVLVRARSHARRVIEALREAGITVSCTDIDPLSETDAVRDMVALIRAIWHPGDGVAWASVLRAPFVGLTWADLVSLRKGATKETVPKALRLALAKEDGLSEDGRMRVRKLLSVYDSVRIEIGTRGDLADMAESAWRSLGGPLVTSEAEADDVARTLLLLRKHLVGGQLDALDGFERGLSTLYANAGDGMVTVMTVHKSKGLEFDTVVLVGLWRDPPPAESPMLAFRQVAGGMLLAPYANRSSEDAHKGLFNLVRRLERFAEEGELQRLAYVAATRARNRLIVMVSGVDSKDQSWSAPPRSMLGSVWAGLGPLLAGEAVRSSTPIPPPEVEDMPRRLRLPADHVTALPDSYMPRVSMIARPSEAVVRSDISVVERNEDSRQRIIGILYHETIDRLIRREEVGQFAVLKDALRPCLFAGARRSGLAEPDVASSVAEVLRLVEATVCGSNGGWLLQRREQGGSEYRVGGYINRSWTAGVVDRFFVEDGQVELIDYKTGGGDISDSGWSAFVEAELEVYEHQLSQYAEILGSIFGLPVRRWLYFPVRDHLAGW